MGGPAVHDRLPNEIAYIGWEPRDEEPPPSAPSSFWSGALRNSLVLRSLERLPASPRRPEVIWNRHGMPYAQDLNMRVFRDPAFNEHDRDLPVAGQHPGP
jgi:hypothetical protein